MSATPNDQVLQQIQQLRDQLQTRDQTSQILSDPDVQALLQRKQAGKQVRIEEVEPEGDLDSIWEEFTIDKEEGKDEGVEEDFPDMNDPQVVVKQAVQATAKMFKEKMTPHLQQKFKSLEEKVDLLLQGHQTNVVNDVRKQVEDAAKKYPDFHLYNKEILELGKQTEGRLSPEELYLIASKRYKKEAPPKEKVETEKPSSFSHSPTELTSLQGRGAMKSIIEEAMGEVDWSDIGF